MTTADEYLKVARAEVGTHENPIGSNRTKYGEFFGVNGVPWCAQFEWWVTNHAGDKRPLFARTAYTPTLAQDFINRKRFGHEPRIGALVFYDFHDSLPRIQHVESVESFTARELIVIGGNTSAGATGSQDDGDQVAHKARAIDSQVVGFGYPDFVKDLPEFRFPDRRLWFGRGDSGADVKRWQLDLNHWIHHLKNPPADFHLEITKEFDGDTIKATKTFQTFYKLDVDARVGQHSIKVMERVRAKQMDD